MKILGIVAEYNPFHNGHKFHLEKAKRITGCDFAVCVMSGSFTQRGEIALVNKWLRAQMATAGGIDLVLELPTVFGVRSAETFAGNAVLLLSRLGIVSHLGFGVETPNLQTLQNIVHAQTNEAVIQVFKSHLKMGLSYHKALSQATSEYLSIDECILAQPNNVLAIEYIRALQKYNLRMIPVPIMRHLSSHNSLNASGSIASATAIRQAIQLNQPLVKHLLPHLPLTSTALLTTAIQHNKIADLEKLAPILLASLRYATAADIKQIPEVAEGLEYKIADCAQKATSVKGLAALLKSKRYPLTRLQRILIHCLLKTNKQFINEMDESGPLYARVLAFNNRGRLLLREIKRKASIPTIMKTAPVMKSSSEQIKLKKMLAVDLFATDLFQLSLSETKDRFGGMDYITSPIYLNQKHFI